MSAEAKTHELPQDSKVFGRTPMESAQIRFWDTLYTAKNYVPDLRRWRTYRQCLFAGVGAFGGVGLGVVYDLAASSSEVAEAADNCAHKVQVTNDFGRLVDATLIDGRSGQKLDEKKIVPGGVVLLQRLAPSNFTINNKPAFKDTLRVDGVDDPNILALCTDTPTRRLFNRGGESARAVATVTAGGSSASADARNTNIISNTINLPGLVVPATVTATIPVTYTEELNRANAARAAAEAARNEALNDLSNERNNRGRDALIWGVVGGAIGLLLGAGTGVATRRGVVTERNTARADLATRTTERDTAITERDVARADLTTRTTERDAAVTERNTARADLATRTTERDTAITERDTIRGEGDVARVERDTARADLATRTTERNAAVTERDTVRGERDTARTERDTVRANEATAQAEARRANTQRTRLETALNTVRTEVANLRTELAGARPNMTRIREIVGRIRI